MNSPLHHLSDAKQRSLLDDLNYLNMGEIKAFCKQHAIPFTIWIETRDGRRTSSEGDRKGIVLDRIRHYLKTGNVPGPTCFPANVVCFEALSLRPKDTDRVFYGQYERKNSAIGDLLKKLTNGEFRDGAIARILLNEFWRKGVAPTYREFANAWQRAKENHTRPNPEWAFLSDRSDHKNTKDWKQLRTKKAKEVLHVITRIERTRTDCLQ